MIQRKVLQLLLGLFLMPLLGCRPEFQTQSQLQEVRVLAMLSSLLEVGFEDTITVTPVVHVPEERSVVLERWTFCPINLGSRVGYQCVIEACNVELTPEESVGGVVFSPGTQLLECISALAATQSTDEAGDNGAGSNEGLPASVNTVLFYDIVSDDDTTLTTILEIPLWLEQVPETRNEPPSISSVTINGEVVPITGGTVAAERLADIDIGLVVDGGSLQAYVDNVGRDREEEAVVSFYATKGRFEAERRVGLDVSNTLSFYAENMEGKRELLLPPEGLTDADSSLTLYGVVRDGRGGQSVAGPFVLELTAN